MYPRSVEWPTIAIAGSIAFGFAAMLTLGDRLPVPATILVLALLGAWYNSLQHEVIHGHPTPWERANRWLVLAPITVLFPFDRYRETHLAHHRDEILTDPELDPESYYVTEAAWTRRGPGARALLLGLQTLLGRMLLGPFVYGSRFWGRMLTALPSDPAARRQAMTHVLAVGGVLAVVVVAPLSLVEYLVGTVWLGASVSFIRSFAEHRTGPQGLRTAVVHSGWFFSLLFLNNNLHVTHHRLPGLAWYRLPVAHAASDDDERAVAGAGLYRGYGEIVRRFAVRPTWVPVHTYSTQDS